MFLHILKSKIHCATVTEANLHYMGSITIDEELMEAAGERHSGCICLNGAAARKFLPGDQIIIMAYALMEPEEAKGFKPQVIFPDEHNRLA